MSNVYGIDLDAEKSKMNANKALDTVSWFGKALNFGGALGLGILSLESSSLSVIGSVLVGVSHAVKSVQKAFSGDGKGAFKAFVRGAAETATVVYWASLATGGAWFLAPILAMAGALAGKFIPTIAGDIAENLAEGLASDLFDSKDESKKKFYTNLANNGVGMAGVGYKNPVQVTTEKPASWVSRVGGSGQQGRKYTDMVSARQQAEAGVAIPQGV